VTLAAPSDPATLVRSRGVFAVSSDQSITDETQIGSIGFAVVSQEAATVGITAVPVPSTAVLDERWFFIEGFIHNFAVQTAVGLDAMAGHQHIIDSRAMRKLNGGDSLVIVVENTAAFGFDIAVYVRFLLKQH